MTEQLAERRNVTGDERADHWKISVQVLGTGTGNIPASRYRTIPLFSVAFQKQIVLRNSSGCRTSANFISAVMWRRVGVALGSP